MRAAFEALRPRQWMKNTFVFAGLIFSENLANRRDDLLVLAAFAIFCVISSSVYLINDLADIEQDRSHPTKCRRPLASGRLSPAAAVVMAVLLGAAGLAASYWINPGFLLLAVIYFTLNLAYSFVLKHVMILDVICVAVFFVLRAAAGAEAIAVRISPWLLICTILLALFLALSKRRHELVLLEAAASHHRRILAEYSPYLLDQMISVVTASTVVCYCLYTLWSETVNKFGTHNLVYTVPFVLFGIYRYLYLVHRAEQGDQPDKVLLTDIPMLVDVALWLAAVVLIIYARP